MANDGVIRKCPKLRITVKLTGLKDNDDSGDGLNDTEEYEMSNNSDTYSVDGRAVPTRKDIFVEVDYMDGHEMSDAAKWKVGTRFLNNPTGEEIWLHIDDDLMGGGGNINDHEDKIDDADWGINNGYFDHQNQKFHYCLFAHLDKDNPDSGLGTADTPGDKLCLFDENIESASEQAHVFMHELGHNIISLYDPQKSYSEHNPDADHLIDTDSDRYYEHCDNECVFQTRLSSSERENIMNFCGECWDAIKLSYSF